MDASFVQDTSLVGIIGAGLLLTGGVVLLFLSWQNRRARGVERLRRVDPEVCDPQSLGTERARGRGTRSGIIRSAVTQLRRHARKSVEIPEISVEGHHPEDAAHGKR